ncbi:hypothetical protein [Patulibacter sp.]|uniref:hypothetical protein n=1 Tax=Patulibacter sp. TaxID=1912859 RepID=UPI00271CD480|nr:hypothetical protein [Patulibacter sp.]MDO9409446.1 hypothetical protein [Patulibacter sp.]
MSLRVPAVVVGTFALGLGAASPALAADVTTEAQLRAALTAKDPTIDLRADVALTAPLPIVSYAATIDGHGFAVDAQRLARVFFLDPGAGRTVALDDVALRGGRAVGGAGGDGSGGGGGGLGAGGAIFLNSGAATLSAVALENAAAAGGPGGGAIARNAGGGGGGLGGAGGSGLNGAGGGGGFLGAGGSGSNGGGGGGGLLGTGGAANNGGGGGGGEPGAGGNAAASGGAGGVIGGAPGGAITTERINNVFMIGGSGGGGGGGSERSAGTDGGSGQLPSQGSDGGAGGAGGIGGGGGGGGTNGLQNPSAGGPGGAGGDFGGGGGVGSGSDGATAAGAGGFGGGGGGSTFGGRVPVPAGAGGYGAGNGGAYRADGGAGDGLGGAIFVRTGSTVALRGGTVSGSTVTAGTGAGAAATASGQDLHLMAGGAAAVDGPSDLELDGTIGGDAGDAGIAKTGTGTLRLTAANTYTGPTALRAGVLELGNGTGSATGDGLLTVGDGATLAGEGSADRTVLASGGTIAPTPADDLTLGSLDWQPGGVVGERLAGLPATGGVVVAGPLTKTGAGTRTFALDATGIAPATTVVLLRATGGITGFTPADFAVTGATGTLAVTGDAITFTTPAAPVGPAPVPVTPVPVPGPSSGLLPTPLLPSTPAAPPAPATPSKPSAPRPSLRLTRTRASAGGGAVDLTLRVSGAGVLSGVATHDRPGSRAAPRASSSLRPGPGRYVHARSAAVRTTSTSTTVRVRLRRTAAGNAARFRSARVALRLTVRFVAADGRTAVRRSTVRVAVPRKNRLR